MTADQVQAEINQMNAAANDLRSQIDAWRRRIAELSEDLAGLEGFRNRVVSEHRQFEEQLGRKRQTAWKAGQVTNSRVAKGLSAMLDNRFGNTFKNNVGNSFNGVLGEVRGAISRTEQEINHLKAQIGAAEADISRMTRKIAAAEAQRDRLRAEEREAREGAR